MLVHIHPSADHMYLITYMHYKSKFTFHIYDVPPNTSLEILTHVLQMSKVYMSKVISQHLPSCAGGNIYNILTRN